MDQSFQLKKVWMLVVYLRLMYLVKAWVPSLTPCLTSLPRRNTQTMVWSKAFVNRRIKEIWIISDMGVNSDIISFYQINQKNVSLWCFHFLYFAPPLITDRYAYLYWDHCLVTFLDWSSLKAMLPKQASLRWATSAHSYLSFYVYSGNQNLIIIRGEWILKFWGKKRLLAELFKWVPWTPLWSQLQPQFEPNYSNGE